MAFGIALLWTALSGPAVAIARHKDSAVAARPAFAQVLGELRGCASLLPASERRAVDRRLGSAGAPGRSLADAATSAHRSVAAEGALELRSLRRLEARRRAGACQALGSSPSTSVGGTAALPSADAGPTPQRHSAAARYSSGESGNALPYVAGGVALALLIAAGLAFRWRRLPYARSQPRPRRYVDRHLLVVLRPLLHFDLHRQAFVLQGIGDRVGPVLREERRRRSEPIRIPDRRQALRAPY